MVIHYSTFISYSSALRLPFLRADSKIVYVLCQGVDPRRCWQEVEWLVMTGWLLCRQIGQKDFFFLKLASGTMSFLFLFL